jgi:hypothetical protein
VRAVDDERRSAAVTLAIYVALTLLVWGLTAAERGLWQDDAAFLAVSADRDPTSLNQLLAPIVAPTRRLAGLPFIAADHTPRPLLTLQLIAGLVWLGTGLLARDLARRLFPDALSAAYVAGALTLCATSDFLTNSLVALCYDLSAFYLAAAACCALRWIAGRPWGWLAASVALAQASLWTVDGGLTSLALLPALFCLAAEPGQRRRAVTTGVVWAVASIPYGLVLARFLADPAGYGAVALHRLPLGVHVARTLDLLFTDFAPWTWAHDRAVWLQAPARLFPTGLVATCATLGTVLFLWGLWYVHPPRAPRAHGPPWRAILVTATLLAMATASHALYALVQFSELHYRTQIYSRLWCSVVLALAFSALFRRLGRLAPAAAALPALFVAFGIAGGLERQEHYLHGWQLQQKELASLVQQAPELERGTNLVLRMPSTPTVFLATEAEYLAWSWGALLYPPSSRPSVFTWVVERGSRCLEAPTGLRCFRETEAACATDGSCPGTLLSYDQLVLFDYQPTSGEYLLVEHLAATSYAPHARIRPGPPTDRQKRLLF